MGFRTKWTDDERKYLLELRAEGWTLEQIAGYFGRSYHAVRSQWILLTETPEQSANRKAIIRQWISVNRHRNTLGKGELFHSVHHTRVDISPLALEAKERLDAAYARQSPTSALLGEPPPGFSALDRRMAEV